jgi:hypothetical protein
MSRGAQEPLRVVPPGGEAVTGPCGWVPLELDISTELDDSLRELVRKNHHTVEDVLVRAVALYRVLSEVARKGKRVGVAREGKDLETEITGF